MAEALTISEVARRAGVRTSTIRYYESIKLLPPARRTNGRRQYDATILEQLAFIHITQKLGFTLTEIQLLFHHEETTRPLPELWQTLAKQKMAEVEQLIQQAIDIQHMLVQGLRCGCSNIAECMHCVRTHYNEGLTSQ